MRFEVSFVGDLNIYIICLDGVHLPDRNAPTVHDLWVLDLGQMMVLGILVLLNEKLVLTNPSLYGFPLLRSQRLKA